MLRTVQLEIIFDVVPSTRHCILQYTCSDRAVETFWEEKLQCVTAKSKQTRFFSQSHKGDTD
jgi:hypothetical protein